MIALIRRGRSITCRWARETSDGRGAIGAHQGWHPNATPASDEGLARADEPGPPSKANFERKPK
ncbi:MAG: hypothetical protein JWM85_2256 [Acidimicrobiaceae bacterium]|nr:hypothetical protein [Acidimicrobiaceae bacterium]